MYTPTSCLLARRMYRSLPAAAAAAPGKAGASNEVHPPPPPLTPGESKDVHPAALCGVCVRGG
eukprot:29026-Pelagococcus_subviridis.AAC.9